MPEQALIIVAIPGKPVAKGRPRISPRGVFTPPMTREAEENMRGYMKVACPKPLPGPLNLEVTFSFHYPPSWSKAEKRAAEDGRETWRVGRPDLDNLVKLVQDAGNGILWEDDAQIVHIEADKIYTSEDGTLINLSPARSLSE